MSERTAFQKLDAEQRRELCSRIDLPALVFRDGYKLFQRGRSIFTKFREERRASVHLWKRNDVWEWHDFGDSKGGDTLAYLCDIRGLPFREAVAELQNLNGVRLPAAVIKTAMERKGISECAEPAKRPETSAGSDAQHRALATLRNVSVETVNALSLQRIISFGRHLGREAFFLSGTDGLFQGKRMDGVDWWPETKALFFGSSSGRWIESFAGSPDRYLIVEGCVGIIEAVELLRRAGITGTAIAMPSAGSIMPHRLAQRIALGAVVIIADGDLPGKGASIRWFETIRAAGGRSINRREMADGMDPGDLLEFSDTDLSNFLRQQFNNPTNR
jgi:hypothetical protein